MCACVCELDVGIWGEINWILLLFFKGGLGEMKIPILADITKQISRDYGVLLPDGFALRGTFIIDPKGVLRQITVNDTPVGRNLDETLRLVEALQYADKHGEVCPVGWTKGARTMKVQRDVLVCVRVGREGKGSRLKV